MRRITISVNDDLADEFDRLLVQRGYQNRSEAFRDLVRGALEADRLSSDTATHCVACLSYIYNHHERDLASRVTAAHHAHHDVSVSTMHVHLDHDHCLEAAILRRANSAGKTLLTSADRRTRRTAWANQLGAR